MISPAQARELLGPKGKALSDEELARLLEALYELAGIVVDTLPSRREREH